MPYCCYLPMADKLQQSMRLVEWKVQTFPVWWRIMLRKLLFNVLYIIVWNNFMFEEILYIDISSYSWSKILLCTPIVLPLYSHYTPIVLPLYSHCTPIVLPLYSHRTLMYSHRTPIVLPPYSHRTPTVLPSYSHHTGVSLFPPWLKVNWVSPIDLNKRHRLELIW
jgi:hypothetical protein